METLTLHETVKNILDHEYTAWSDMGYFEGVLAVEWAKSAAEYNPNPVNTFWDYKKLLGMGC